MHTYIFVSCDDGLPFPDVDLGKKAKSIVQLANLKRMKEKFERSIKMEQQLYCDTDSEFIPELKKEYGSPVSKKEGALVAIYGKEDEEEEYSAFNNQLYLSRIKNNVFEGLRERIRVDEPWASYLRLGISARNVLGYYNAI